MCVRRQYRSKAVKALEQYKYIRSNVDPANPRRGPEDLSRLPDMYMYASGPIVFIWSCQKAEIEPTSRTRTSLPPYTLCHRSLDDTQLLTIHELNCRYRRHSLQHTVAANTIPSTDLPQPYSPNLQSIKPIYALDGRPHLRVERLGRLGDDVRKVRRGREVLR